MDNINSHTYVSFHYLSNETNLGFVAIVFDLWANIFKKN